MAEVLMLDIKKCPGTVTFLTKKKKIRKKIDSFRVINKKRNAGNLGQVHFLRGKLGRRHFLWGNLGHFLKNQSSNSS